jgi:hypothetical protein
VSVVLALLALYFVLIIISYARHLANTTTRPPEYNPYYQSGQPMGHM